MIAVVMLATLSILSAICGGPRSPMDVGSAAPFVDEGATQDSGYDGLEPRIEMEKRGDRWFITVYQGRQQSGGYAIQVVLAIHVGTGMRTISLGVGADGISLYDQDDRRRADLIRP